MIRKAIEKNIEKINELGRLINENFVNLFDMNKIINEDISVVYVYEINDLLVGFLHATRLYETVDIINVVVDPAYRNKGVASNLIDTMITELDKNVELITLEVATKNEAAINLYKKFGFEIINERKDYYKNDNAYLMGKKIIYEE